MLLVAVLVAATTTGCAKPAPEKPKTGEHEGGEHDRDGDGHHDGDGKGEESGKQLALDEKYDNVRHGARLILAYDKQTNSFKGTVENTTEKTLKRVRVEVHLSNGKELGPTKPGDLKPHEKRDVALTAKSDDFKNLVRPPGSRQRRTRPRQRRRTQVAEQVAFVKSRA